MGCLFPLARRKLSQAVVSNPIADKAQGGETEVGRHATHLAVAAFTDAEFQPAGRDGLALRRICELTKYHVGLVEQKHRAFSDSILRAK